MSLYLYLFLMTFLGLFFSCSFVLSYSDVFLFYFMLLLSLRYLFFSNKRSKGVDPDGKRGDEELEGAEGKETIIKICWMKTKLFLKKRHGKDFRNPKTPTLKQRLSEKRFLILPGNRRKEIFKILWFHFLESLSTFFSKITAYHCIGCV